MLISLHLITLHPSSCAADVCEECCTARMKQEQADRAVFKNSKIYIRKLSADKEVLSAVVSQASNSSAEDSDKDPEFMQVRHSVLLVQMSRPCRVGSVGSVSTSRMVGREFASRPDHTKDHHKYGIICLPA